MRIGIDAIHVSRGHKGASRFERSIIKTIAEQKSEHEFIVFLDCDHVRLDLPTSGTITYVTARVCNLLCWEQFQLPLLAHRYQVHCLITLADRIPLIYRGDIVTYLFEIPDYRHRMSKVTGVTLYQRASDLLTRLMFPSSLSRAACIATASQFTNRDLQTQYGISSSKIKVVHADADDEFQPTHDQVHLDKVRRSYGAPDGYVLHLSTNDPRDNTPVALAAFSDARLPVSKKLLIAGGGGLESTGLASLISELGLSDRIVLIGFQTGQSLVDLYQAADAYIDPSLYEGFGFQVLEAMACGVPVLCSNTTSLPEVVGTAAMTYPPSDARGFALGLEAVLSTGDQATGMRKAGLEQAQLFSWNRTVKQLVRICETISD